MRLVELVEAKAVAVRAREVAHILGFSVRHIHKMAAEGQIRSGLLNPFSTSECENYFVSSGYVST
jgi:hypothetical protein